MTARRVAAGGVAAGTVLAAAVAIGAGQPAFKSQVDLVLFTVTVSDVDGHPAIGLGPQDFQIVEDGQRQSVALVAADTVPLDVVLLVDASGSMKDRMPVVRDALRRFVGALRAHDRASIASFTSTVRVLTALTGETGALATAIAALEPHGHTALYDALYVVLRGLVRPAGDRIRRRALVLLTDGDDTRSLNTHDEVLELARTMDVAIYTVALPDQDRPADARPGARATLPPSLRRADFELNTLARETGGRSYRAVHSRELTSLYDHIVADLSHQYTVGYVTTDTRRDGRFRRVTVGIPSRPDVTVRSRAGYYAPGPRPSGLDGELHPPVAPLALHGARARW